MNNDIVVFSENKRIDKLLHDFIKNHDINGELYICRDYIKINSCLIINGKLPAFNFHDIAFYSKFKTIIYKHTNSAEEWDWTEIIIDGIKYINFVTKNNLKSIPYFKNGCMSGSYSDKMPEIMLKSNPISSMLLLRYIYDTDTFVYFVSNYLQFEKNENQEIICSMIELMKFLLIKIDYHKIGLIFDTDYDLISIDGLFKVPVKLCMDLYTFILNQKIGFKKIGDISTKAFKIMDDSKQATIWLKVLSKKHSVSISIQ